MNDYEIITIKKPKKKKTYCVNCGKFGHNIKRCNEPITSIGIIAYKIDLNKVILIL